MGERCLWVISVCGDFDTGHQWGWGGDANTGMDHGDAGLLLLGQTLPGGSNPPNENQSFVSESERLGLVTLLCVCSFKVVL